MAQQVPLGLLPLHLALLVRLGLRLQLQARLVRQELQDPPEPTLPLLVRPVPLVVALVLQVLQAQLQRLQGQLAPRVQVRQGRPAQLLL